MPCDGAWPEEKIDAFERWVTTGMIRAATPSAADSSGAQRADVVADLLQRCCERGELAWVQVLHEVLLDAAMVHGPRVPERLASRWRDQDLDHAPILWWSLATDEAVGFHAVDHAGQAALAGQDAIGELGHAQPVGRVLEVDERVIPDQREVALALQLGIEDVDQRARRFDEDAPMRELSMEGLDINSPLCNYRACIYCPAD